LHKSSFFVFSPKSEEKFIRKDSRPQGFFVVSAGEPASAPERPGIPGGNFFPAFAAKPRLSPAGRKKKKAMETVAHGFQDDGGGEAG